MDIQRPEPLRRSPVQDLLVEDGMETFTPWRGGHVFGSVANRASGEIGVDGLWLFDASPAERHRFLIAGAPVKKSALSRGQAARTGDGWLTFRAGPSDLSFLPPFTHDAKPAPAVPAAWRRATAEPGLQHGYWFYVTGDAATQLFTRGCEVDMRPSRFDNHAVTQVLLFRTSVTVIREDTAISLGYHILGCSSLAHHLYGKIRALQATHGGGLLGLDDVRQARG